jgi:hypothetical protein
MSCSIKLALQPVDGPGSHSSQQLVRDWHSSTPLFL